jgi:hypothetical protein
MTTKGRPHEPCGPRILSAVPQTLHTQLEIAKAIRTLAGPDEDEMLRQRRAEIAAIRRDLDVLARGVRKLAKELPALVMAELKKYSADQPRVPAGNTDGGQWTSGSKAGTDAPSTSASSGDAKSGGGQPTNGVAQQTTRVAARRISPAREAEWEAQYAQDIFQCKMVGLMACYAQAALRYANCLQGPPLPPLNY